MPEFQELPEQGNTFRDQFLNFRVTKLGEQWKFSDAQTSADPLSRVVGLEYDAKNAIISPRVRIYTHEWNNSESPGNCSHIRDLGREYVKQNVTAINAYVNWTDASSPYYGGKEVCEEIGEVYEENKRLGFVRFVGMTSGTRQFTFVLISDLTTWNADNAVLFELVESFSTIEPWRSVRFAVAGLLICLAVLNLRKRRIKTMKTFGATSPNTST